LYLLGGVLFLLSEPAFSLLDDGQFDTLLSRERDKRGLLAKDEDVGSTSSKMVADGVLQMDDIETSVVFILVFNETNTTSVGPASDHGQDSGFEFHEIDDLVGDKIEFDGVSSFDQGVGVTDGSSVVGDNMGDSTHADRDSPHLAEFELGFFGSDSVNRKSSFGIIEKTEVFASSVEPNDVHETSRVFNISTDLAVDLDKTGSTNLANFSVSQGVLQSVSEEDDQGKTFPKFVGTIGGTRSPNSTHFVQHPMLGSI